MAEDPICKEIRDIEAVIDNAYKANSLLSLHFVEAAKYFLSACEDRALASQIRGEYVSPEEGAARADYIVNVCKWPLRWFWAECSGDSPKPVRYRPDAYQACIDMYDLADKYADFESVFTYGSRDLLTLQLTARTIRASWNRPESLSFEAYDHIVDAAIPFGLERSWAEKLPPVGKLIDRRVIVRGRKFTCDVQRPLFEAVRAVIEPTLDLGQFLPLDTSVSSFTIGDFRQVVHLLRTLAFIYQRARIVAARSGCPGMCFESGLVEIQRGKLIHMLVSWMGLPVAVAGQVLSQLTFGSSGIRSPDVALQPLIDGGDGVLVFSPSLIANSSMERNYCALLNRIPSERAAYSRVSGRREDVSIQRISAAASQRGWRTISFKLPNKSGLPDVDLAIVSDDEKRVLVLEVKSFLAPADASEVIDRFEEIEKAHCQIATLRSAFHQEPTLILDRCGANIDYDVSFGISSETSVGRPGPSGAIVMRNQHLIRLIEAGQSVASLCSHLESGSFLPREGRHFDLVKTESVIEGWGASWYRVRVRANLTDLFEN